MLNTTSPEQEHLARSRQWQEHYQRELENYGGGQVPAPVYGESTNAYRRKMCVLFKRQFLPQEHPLYGVQYKGLPSDALEPFETKLIDACKSEAYNPSTVPPGELRQITKILFQWAQEHRVRRTEIIRQGNDRPRSSGSYSKSNHRSWLVSEGGTLCLDYGSMSIARSASRAYEC